MKNIFFLFSSFVFVCLVIKKLGIKFSPSSCSKTWIILCDKKSICQRQHSILNSLEENWTCYGTKESVHPTHPQWSDVSHNFQSSVACFETVWMRRGQNFLFVMENEMRQVPYSVGTTWNQHVEEFYFNMKLRRNSKDQWKSWLQFKSTVTMEKFCCWKDWNFDLAVIYSLIVLLVLIMSWSWYETKGD